jgi:hypothetical protein
MNKICGTTKGIQGCCKSLGLFKTHLENVLQNNLK